MDLSSIKSRLSQSPELLLLVAASFNPPVISVAAYLLGGPALLSAGVSAVIVLLAYLSVRFAMKGAEYTVALSLIAQPAILLAVLQGHPWQVDIHMYFFALMALLSVLPSFGPLIAAAGFVAVHHLGLNFLMPTLIYPGGSDLGRTLVHAVILIVETAMLCCIVYRRSAQNSELAASAAAAEELAADAQAATDEIVATREANEEARARMNAALSEAFGSVAVAAAGGNLTNRVQTDWDDPALSDLAAKVNDLLASVEDAVGDASGVLKDYADDRLETKMQERRGVYGDLGRSVATLREKLMERKRLDAAQAKEAETARQRSRENDDFQGDVEAVVAAALAGDFSARISDRWLAGEKAQIATSLNRLMGSINHAVAATVGMLEAMASGDVSARIEGDFAGDFAKMKSDANIAATRITEIVLAIHASSDSISEDVRNILSGSNDLSDRTARQAATAQELNATMTDLNQSISAAAKETNAANGHALSLAKTASQSGVIAEEATTKMAGVAESSVKISEITAMVEGIAFQTNLLALNARVEAARAGEAGKGFAVVAQEVGDLATRATEASQEIASLVSSSRTEIDDGVELVRQAGEALKTIGAGVSEISVAINGVSELVASQSDGFAALSASFGTQDHETQMNAQLAAQSAGSANALARKAQELRAVAERFRVGDEAAAHSAKARVA